MNVHIVILIFLIALAVGIHDVFAETQETASPDVRARHMEFSGAAKPFTDKFLKEINTNSAAFRKLFEFVNYQSQPAGAEVDELEAALDHCKLVHRSEATELMLEVGLIFQEECLGAVKVLSPDIDKTVAEFLAELKESSEDAHEEALDCSKREAKGPELLLECLRTVVDEHYLPLHSYLDSLAVMYVKMQDILKNMETCEREVIDIIESKIEELIDGKVAVKCVNRVEVIDNYFGTLANDGDAVVVEDAVRYYRDTILNLREGVKVQMDVVLTRRPLRTMIKVIGKFLENEAQKMSDEIIKRIEAIEKLGEKFDECVLDTPTEIKSFLDDSISKLSYCGAAVSNVQYEFDVGLSSLAEKAVGLFASMNEEAIKEKCVSIDETALENVKCIKNELLSQVSDVVVPLERSVAEFLFEQFLKYTNMDAHLTVKECISKVTKDMNDVTVEAMKGIQECATGGRKDHDAEKDEL